jgi:transcriptional regulator with XRE-family HTH domain
MPDQETQSEARSELASFGEELKREREIRGISLKEIADATKISKRFLEAIERNDHRTLPAPVFTRGFVREYARYLGLNVEEIVNRYNFASAGDERIEKPHMHPINSAPPRDITPRTQPKRGIPPPYAGVDRNVILLILIAAALGAVAYWAVVHKRIGLPGSEPEVVPPVITAPASIKPPVLAPSKPADDRMLRLTLEVTNTSWVTLEADGKTVINAEMAPGERRSFEAKDQFRFRTIGNAAGLRLTLNETLVPSLGEDGEVVKNRVFDREALQTMRAGISRGGP